MSKQYASNQALNEKLLKGVNTLADNVGSTLGPRGRNVILHQKDKNPIVTKDGVTVASFIDLEDPMENVGAQMLSKPHFKPMRKQAMVRLRLRSCRAQSLPTPKDT